jgi:very-short-patch-repair endonuclease
MKTYFCKKCNKNISSNNFNRHVCYTDDDVIAVQVLYNKGLSKRKITKEGYSKRCIIEALKKQSRNSSEASKLAHKLYPDNFKCSKKTKAKLSKSRLLFLKNHPEIKPWQHESYPEKLFQNLVEKNELAKKYDIVREYSFFPFFIDFAFVNIKLAVEIDGSLHWKDSVRVQKDKEKDELLISNNWKVYRIPSFLIKNQFEKTEHEFLKYLSMFENQPKQFIFTNEIIKYEEIIKYKKQLKDQEKKQNKQDRLQIKQQLINKRLEDIKEISLKYGYITKLAKLWNVTNTQVSRFIKENNLI